MEKIFSLMYKTILFHHNFTTFIHGSRIISLCRADGSNKGCWTKKDWSKWKYYKGYALANFKKSGSKYILTTSHTWKNFQPKDISLGDFRKLNLQMPPINLPAPLDFIVEGNQEYMQADRCMLLYECKDL